MRRGFAPEFLRSAIFLFSLLVIAAPAALGQAPSRANTSTVAPGMYDLTGETQLSGTITEVSTKAKPGLPLGLHVMISTAQGAIYVHLGPYFSRIAAQDGLVAGATIQVTGAVSHFQAGDVFLARTVTVGSRTITVRNKNGFPARPMPSGTRAGRGAQPSGGQ